MLHTCTVGHFSNQCASRLDDDDCFMPVVLRSPHFATAALMLAAEWSTSAEVMDAQAASG